MLNRISTKLLLKPEFFEPTDSWFEVIGAFNPGAARFNDEIILLVRVAEAAKEQKSGKLLSPRAIFEGGSMHYEIEEFEVVDASDPRKPLLEKGMRRLSFISHLEIVHLSADGLEVKQIEKHPDLLPREVYEEFGLEDPRITKIDDTYYITYVAVSADLAITTALMSTKDFKTFTRLGIIFDMDTKDVVMMPKKFDGKYVAYTRPLSHIAFKGPSVQMAKSLDLIHWGEYEHVFGVDDKGWQSMRVGMGSVGLETKHGWLSFYHGVGEHGPKSIGTYRSGAVLTDSQNPGKVIARSSEPMLEGEQIFETTGFVKNVIFPMGCVQNLHDPDLLLLYYGCADSDVSVVQLSLADVLEHLGISD